MAHHIFTRRAGEDSAAPAAQVPRRVLQRRSNPAYNKHTSQRAPQPIAAAASTATATRDQIEGGQSDMTTATPSHHSQQQHQYAPAPLEPEALLAPTLSLSLSMSPSGSPAPSVFSSTSGGGGFDSLLAHHITGEQQQQHQDLAARRRGTGAGAEYGPPPRLWMLGRNSSVADAGGVRPMRKLVKEPGTGGSARPSFSLEIPGEDSDARRRGARPRAAATSGPEMESLAEERSSAGGLVRKRVVDRLMGFYRRGDR